MGFVANYKPQGTLIKPLSDMNMILDVNLVVMGMLGCCSNVVV